MSKLAVRDLNPSTLEVANEQVVGGYYYSYSYYYEQEPYNYQGDNNFNQQNSDFDQYNSTFVFDNSYN